MNVTNFAPFFQRNAVFSPGQTLFQPQNDALNRLSDRLLGEQEKTQRDLKERFDTLELSEEAAASQKDSALEEMPEGLLHYYLNLCKVGACISQQNEASLTEYRDQLTAFDETIQGYQDVLDGRAEMPAGMNRETVSALLERTRAARTQFLQEGAETLNRLGREAPTPEDFLRRACETLTGSKENGDRWQIDPEAEDIYGEIDRALGSAHKTTSAFQQGASKCLHELKKRDCLQAGEEGDPDEPEADRASVFQELYETVWTALRL